MSFWLLLSLELLFPFVSGFDAEGEGLGDKFDSVNDADDADDTGTCDDEDGADEDVDEDALLDDAMALDLKSSKASLLGGLMANTIPKNCYYNL